jgi:uncharacterized protein
MPQIQINVLTNAALYLLPQGLPTGVISPGGSGIGGLLGQASEIECPNPKHVMSDYKGLGMLGKVKLWMGVDNLEASIKWLSFNPAIFNSIANPFISCALQVMGNIQQMTSAGNSGNIPAKYICSGVFGDGGMMAMKTHEQVEIPTKMDVYHAELWIAGVQVYMYDVFSNSYTIGGVDATNGYLANLGY